eukprot:COSAG06_NODE_1709_length_8635_cov_5.655599_3_plen_95_part_00
MLAEDSTDGARRARGGGVLECRHGLKRAGAMAAAEVQAKLADLQAASQVVESESSPPAIPSALAPPAALASSPGGTHTRNHTRTSARPPPYPPR